MVRESRALGKYELPPRLPMSEAVKTAAKLVGQFRDNTFTDAALASALGHSNSTGGAFNQKVADLRKYGVITGRAPQLGTGPIAQAIFADRPGEKERALREMLMNIPLFKTLYEEFGDKSPDDSTLTTFLLNVTGAGRPDIESGLASLRDAYRDACGSVPAMAASTKTEHHGPGFGRDLGLPATHVPGATGDRFSSTTAEYEFSVADDMDAIDSLIDQLQSRRKALERKSKAAPKAHPQDGAAGRSVTPPAEGAPPAGK